MTFSTAEKLISYWKSQNLILAKGNDETALIRFEAKYSLQIPPDLRQYLAMANGMLNTPGSDVDSHGFRFWPLDRIGPLPTVCDEMGVQIPAVEDPSRYFVFADYLDWSWAYAIALNGDIDLSMQPVIHVGTLEPKTIALSFSEFINLYVEDTRVLYVLPAEHQTD